MVMCVVCLIYIVFLMRYFLSFFKLERINFILSGLTLLFIAGILNIKIHCPLKFTRNIGIDTQDQNNINIIHAPSTYFNKIQSSFDEYHYKVKDGDTLIKILSTNIGFKIKDSYIISHQINQLYNLTGLNTGQYLKFIFSSNIKKTKKNNLPNHFSMHIEDKIIGGTINKKNHHYKFKLFKQILLNKSKLVRGYTNHSLYNAAIAKGASMNLVMNFIKLLSENVNFQKDVKPNTEFKILFNYKENSDGRIIDTEDIIYGYLSNQNHKYEIYQYKDSKGIASYHHGDGRKLNNLCLSKPIQKARISSGFGMRYHPVLKKNKMHKGIDYAAKIGVPIMAVEDGIIQIAKYGAGYGKYLAIQHNDKYSTLYAHMSKFQRGIKGGKKVKKGDIIGYVGNTGNSTGSHLHYEIRKNGKAINPIKIKVLISNTLQGEQLVAFSKQKKRINEILHKESKIILN